MKKPLASPKTFGSIMSTPGRAVFKKFIDDKV
jgi:hypothetical protein